MAAICLCARDESLVAQVVELGRVVRLGVKASQGIFVTGGRLHLVALR